MWWIQNLDSADWNLAGRICLCAYLLGCFATGYYLVRMRTGQDIREIGSGSIGARNVSRVLGKGGFFLTVLFDVGKGLLAVWAARQVTSDDRLVAMSMLAVVSGHIWPVQLRFHGGKGMATALGGLLLYDTQLALVFVVLFLALSSLMRRTVLPSLCALATIPAVAMFLGHNPPKVVLLSVLAGLVLVAHRKNLVEEILNFVPRRSVQPKPDRPQL